MVFTTHFGLHSQTNRLFEIVSHKSKSWVKDGILTLYDVLFQRTCTNRPAENASLNYNSPEGDFKFELIPLHSPLLGESLLVSFPPLIDMLKFSGSSYLIWDQGSRGFRPFFGIRTAELKTSQSLPNISALWETKFHSHTSLLVVPNVRHLVPLQQSLSRHPFFTWLFRIE